MMRKLATFAAALLIPGGLTALLGLWLYEQAVRTEWGQRRLVRARALAAPWQAQMSAQLTWLAACRPHWPQLRGR
jgi:hypothetical protein